MGANFYERFKNKELMNLFKRLCTQNQQRKFDALWQVLDNMCAELLKEQASTSSRRRSGGGPFTQWIKDAPKEAADLSHSGLRMHLRRSGQFYTTLVVVDMGSRQPTTQSVRIW